MRSFFVLRLWKVIVARDVYFLHGTRNDKVCHLCCVCIWSVKIINVTYHLSVQHCRENLIMNLYVQCV
jgi:hypothetical protein